MSADNRALYRPMLPPELDLFGQVAISHDDVFAWLRAVPRIDPHGPRAAAYVRSYSVVEKITAAKLTGTFAALTQAPEPPPVHWWRRFNWR